MNKLFLACLLCASVLGVRSMTNTSGSYSRIKSLRESLISPNIFTPALRPVLDQTTPITVSGFISLVSIVSLDDVKQELVTNGFLVLMWQDETRGWNVGDYGTIYQLELQMSDIWYPRLQIINAPHDRDPFEDSPSYTVLTSFGQTVWMPGGIFRTNCDLDLTSFPFDVQTCKIEMCPINHNEAMLKFSLSERLDMAFFFPNSGLDLLESKVINENKKLTFDTSFSCPTIYFKLKRRSTTIVLNIILPVVLLSLLNNLVFLIPLESGENIGYAITVLLSMMVFLTVVSSMTPQVSDRVPALSIYLFILLLNSVVTVIVVILSERRHHQDEMEQQTRPEVKHDNKIRQFDADLDFSTAIEAVAGNDRENDDHPVNTNGQGRHGIFAGIRKRMNLVFFGIVMTTWSVSTVWLFVSTSTS